VVLNLIEEYKRHIRQHDVIDKNYFIYHPNNELSTFAVSLLQFPYEQSAHWKTDMAASIGYQKQLFEQDFKSFERLIQTEHKDELSDYLKTEEDKSSEEVISAINYLKLRKIRKLLLQNHADFEKASPEQQMDLFLTHKHLKEMEMEITRKLGTVILK
jgi:DNA primase